MLTKCINFIQRKRHRFVTNQTGGVRGLNKRALLYYKTDPFYNKAEVLKYSHTNSWEILEIVRILNHYGFIVDIIDRSVDDYLPEDIYDLFIGLGAGNSGKHYAKYASVLKKAVKILYAAGPDPDESNKLVMERYDRFNKRTGSDAPSMRTITELNFKEFVTLTDCIFCIGREDSFAVKTYQKFNVPVYPILPSTSPLIKFSNQVIESRKRNNFLCFAGHGFICKGVDILVEAFLRSHGLNLYICGPDSEKSFFNVYGDSIRSTSNIFYEGFISVGREKFDHLCASCAYVIFNTASEGCATSVAACLRAGLVPIVNYESGIDTGDFGFDLKDREDRIGDTRKTAMEAAGIDRREYRERVYKTLASSLQYTQDSFTNSFSKALLDVMNQFSA